MIGLHYQALAQDDFHHYRHELAILSQVESRSPWASYLKDEISTAQSAVLSGEDQTPPELRGYIPFGAGAAGAAVFIAATAGLWLGLRRRRAARKAAAATAEAVTSQPLLAGVPVPEVQMAGVASSNDDVPNPMGTSPSPSDSSGPL